MSAMPSVAGIIHSVPMHCIQASVMGYMMVVVRNCALAEARQRLALGDHAPAVRRLARGGMIEGYFKKKSPGGYFGKSPGGYFGKSPGGYFGK